MPKTNKNDAVVPTPEAHPTEKPLAIPLWEHSHFCGRSILWDAQTAKICSGDQTVAFRVLGIEYRQGEYGPYPLLLLAVIPLDSPDDCPEGWTWNNGD